jgi:hypothetical protein
MPFAPGDRLAAAFLAACLLLSPPALAQRGAAPWLQVEIGNGLAAAPCADPCLPEADIGISAGVGAGVENARLRAGVHAGNWTPVLRTPAQSLSTFTVRGGATFARVWTVEAGGGVYRFQSGRRTRARGAVAELAMYRALGRWRGARSRLAAGYLHGLGGRIALPDDAPIPGDVPFRPRILSVGIALAWGTATR